MKPHGFYQKLSIYIGMGMARISVETTVIIYFTPIVCFVVVIKSLSHIWFFAIPWTAACQDSLSFTISRSLLKLMFIESVMPSNHLFLCRPLLFLTSISPSIRVFSDELVLHIRWPQYWSFSFSISPSNEYSGLISFKIDLFDRLAAQGTLKSLLQHHSSKAFILWCSGYFMVQLTSIHDYWKNCSLCCQSHVCFLKHYLVLSQLFIQGARVF